MPITPESFTIDPQGIPVTLTITTLDGDSVTCYTAQNGSTPVVFDDGTFSDPVTCWFVATVPPQDRDASKPKIRSDVSATDYLVSATFNGVEIAASSGPATVEARSVAPLTYTIEIDDNAELAAMLDAGFLGGEVPDSTYFLGGIVIPTGTPEPLGKGIVITDESNNPRISMYDFGDGVGPYIVWADTDGRVRAFYWGGAPDGYLHFKGSWIQEAAPADSDDTDPIAFGIFGGELEMDDRPTIATQVGVVSVTAFNQLRDACIALGLVIDGD